jgi:Spy/CpxP family protein refolding chaperone
MESKTSGQMKARLVVLAVFVVGFAVGALSMNLYNRIQNRSPEERRGIAKSEHIIRKMDQRLDLTQEQQERIRAILDETMDKYMEIRQEMQPLMKDFEPRFNAVRQQSRDRIRALLSPEQLPKFEEMARERDEKLKERFKK